jgi:hypothetical protein
VLAWISVVCPVALSTALQSSGFHAKQRIPEFLDKHAHIVGERSKSL